MDKAVEGVENTREAKSGGRSAGEVARKRLGKPVHLYAEEIAALLSILTLVQDGRHPDSELRNRAHRLREVVSASL